MRDWSLHDPRLYFCLPRKSPSRALEKLAAEGKIGLKSPLDVSDFVIWLRSLRVGCVRTRE
jgi:hypothetical protein